MKLETGLRTIAIIEAAKGGLILLAGFGALSLVDRDVADVATRILHRFHLNPASRYPAIFLDAAENVTDPQLWTLAAFAFFYATVRLSEGWGLWKGRVWAEWLAAISSAVYIPIEIYEIAQHATWIKWMTFAINVFIVLYMVYALRRRKAILASLAAGSVSAPGISGVGVSAPKPSTLTPD